MYQFEVIGISWFEWDARRGVSCGNREPISQWEPRRKTFCDFFLKILKVYSSCKENDKEDIFLYVDRVVEAPQQSSSSN